MTIDRETVIRLANDCKRLAQPFKRPGYDGPYLDLLKSIDKLAALVLEDERKPLTDEQIVELCDLTKGEFSTINLLWDGDAVKFARVIEAAHGITNKESSDVSK